MMDEVTIDGRTYPVHEAAKSFPMMTDKEFQELKDDIAKNGCRVPLTIWDGQLLDGRNRLKACEELGIEPWTEELDTEHDPWAYVISHNLHRRHLTVGQRLEVALKLANQTHGGDRKSDQESKCTLEEAARRTDVSVDSLKRMKKVEAEGSTEVRKAVVDGSLPVSTAAKLVKAVPDKAKQSEIVAKGPKKVRETLKQTKLPLAVEPEPMASEPVVTVTKQSGLSMLREAWAKATQDERVAFIGDDETLKSVNAYLLFLSSPEERESYYRELDELMSLNRGE